MAPHPAPGLRQLDVDIWVAEAPLRYFAEMGRRMTVIRGRDGKLLVHSPVEGARTFVSSSTSS